MYTFKFGYNGIKESGYNKKYTTFLNAEFKFKDEIAPKDRKNVKERMRYLEEKGKGIPQLKNYLSTKGFKYETIPFYTYEKFVKKVDSKEQLYIDFKMDISKHICGIGFTLTGTANSKIDSLEKIIDLEELNNFILDGKR